MVVLCNALSQLQDLWQKVWSYPWWYPAMLCPNYKIYGRKSDHTHGFTLQFSVPTTRSMAESLIVPMVVPCNSLSQLQDLWQKVLSCPWWYPAILCSNYKIYGRKSDHTHGGTLQFSVQNTRSIAESAYFRLHLDKEISRVVIYRQSLVRTTEVKKCSLLSTYHY